MLRALGLPGGGLQWVQGGLDASLTETAAGLSAIADRLPPLTTTARLPVMPAGHAAPSLSQAYWRLLGAVLPETGVGLRGCLGAAYPGWVAYRNAAPTNVNQRALFRRWAGAALPEGKRGIRSAGHATPSGRCSFGTCGSGRTGVLCRCRVMT